MFIIINASTVELPVVERYCADVVGDRPVVLWNLELDTLRSDLGLFGFPSKDVHYRFLTTFLSVFYLRPRDYSKSVAVAPFIINYSGAIFREYPGPWQVRLGEGRGGILQLVVWVQLGRSRRDPPGVCLPRGREGAREGMCLVASVCERERI